MREVLPARRASDTFEFSHALDTGQQRFTATVSFYADGRIAEIFLNSRKAGTGLDVSVRDAAVAVSIALQHGTPLEVLAKAMTRNITGEPSSPIGKLLDLLSQPVEMLPAAE